MPNKSVTAFKTNLMYLLPFLFRLFLNSWCGADSGADICGEYAASIFKETCHVIRLYQANSPFVIFHLRLSFVCCPGIGPSQLVVYRLHITHMAG
jgi:hypothetical protein